MAKKKKTKSVFERFAAVATTATGTPAAFIIAVLVVIVWAICGPLFDFSETWQLVINTGTTIITFLMIFVIQHTQNKDTLALQLKLNELIAANEHTSNHLIDIEDLTAEELQTIKKYYKKLADLADTEESVYASHSLDEAEADSKRKQPSASKKSKDSKK